MIESLLIGVAGSIIASVVIALFLSLCEIDYKSKTKARLSVIQNYVWIIGNKCAYMEDYHEVIHSAEEILRIVLEIGDHTKWLNRASKKRKIFFTILYDLQRRCERICFNTVGYDDREEISARIDRIRKDNFKEDDCLLCYEVDMLNQLLVGENPLIPQDLIDINSFKSAKSDDEYIRRYGVSSKEFDQYRER